LCLGEYILMLHGNCMNQISFIGKWSYLCILCLTITLISASCGGGGGSSSGGGAESTTYSISGAVTLNGAYFQGVTITLNGASSANTTTDASGNYTFSGLANGSYTVTPGKTGFTFNPTSTAVSISGSNSTGNNFTSTTNPLLSISTNGRYLVDQDNVPFLIVGDAPQSLIVNLSTTDANTYFSNRKAYGVNTVWISLLCETYTAGRADGSTYDGIIPFATPNDLSTPNEAYFSRVDEMIQLATNYGLVVILDPIETGGWLSVLRTNGITKARNYGRYLGNRYRSFNNIVWMSGCDFWTWDDPTDNALVQAVALGIKDNDTRHMHTIELSPGYGSLEDSMWAPIIGLDAAYTYYATYALVLQEYNRSNHLPIFLVEANYEFESNAGYLTTPAILRRQEYWTMLSGAAGQLYGNHYIWTFSSGWQSNLDTPGILQLSYLKSFFASRPWYNLIPDQNQTTVTAGYGTFSANGEVNTNDYLTAARSPDGSLVIAYIPTIRTITIDMSRLSGSATARWYDPSNGIYTVITGSPLANAGMRTFTPPGNNSAGEGDWVLVLER
jgi:hypothetical protein